MRHRPEENDAATRSRLGWDLASKQANTVEYNRLFNRSLMRRLSDPK
jgi:hypothetical protein